MTRAHRPPNHPSFAAQAEHHEQHAHAGGHAEHTHPTTTWGAFRHNIVHQWKEYAGPGGMHRLGFFTNKLNPFSLVVELFKARRQAKENRMQDKWRAAAKSDGALREMEHMVLGKYFEPEMNRTFDIALTSLEWAKKKGLLEKAGLASKDIEFLQNFISYQHTISREWNSLRTYWLKAQKDPEYAEKYIQRLQEYSKIYNEFRAIEQQHGEHVDSMLVLGKKFYEDWRVQTKN